MPRFHTPQENRDFTVHEHVVAMDTDGLPFFTLTLTSVPGESVFDLLDRAEKQVDKDRFEVIDWSADGARPVLIVKEI